MANNPKLHVTKREVTGRKVKQLRREGKVPANIFGAKVDSVAVTMDAADFAKLSKEVGESTVVDVLIEGESKARPVLLSGIQHHPVDGSVLHVDLKQVDLTVKVTAAVAVELTGESPAVAEKDGVVFAAATEVEVEALPNDLPDTLKLDISGLADIGDTLTAADLKLGANVELVSDPEMTLVSIQEQQQEEPETAEVAEGDDGESTEGEAETSDSADTPATDAAPASEE